MEAILHSAFLIFSKVLVFATCLLIAAFIICALFDICVHVYELMHNDIIPWCKQFKKDWNNFCSLTKEEIKWKIKVEVEYYWKNNKEFLILLFSIGAPTLIGAILLYNLIAKYLF